MTIAEFKSKRVKADAPEAIRSPALPSGGPARRRVRVIPVLITLATTALATLLGWGMWDAYMGAPWTRDSTVRTYVVTKAPEVAGRVVELPVADNQFVHKGDCWW
jgi:multidrug resistance efflux pump